MKQRNTCQNRIDPIEYKQCPEFSTTPVVFISGTTIYIHNTTIYTFSATSKMQMKIIHYDKFTIHAILKIHIDKFTAHFIIYIYSDIFYGTL